MTEDENTLVEKLEKVTSLIESMPDNEQVNKLASEIETVKGDVEEVSKMTDEIDTLKGELESLKGRIDELENTPIKKGMQSGELPEGGEQNKKVSVLDSVIKTAYPENQF